MLGFGANRQGLEVIKSSTCNRKVNILGFGLGRDRPIGEEKITRAAEARG
jgi:hypothetical protein